MRKRSRGRGLNGRGGRGAANGSRATRGKSASQLKQGQSPPPSALSSSSTIKFITQGNNHIDSNLLKHQRQLQSSSYLNGTHSRTNGELKIKNGLAVNSFASIMENAASMIEIEQSGFYLHKKFKKVSSTAEINSSTSSNNESEQNATNGNSEEKLETQVVTNPRKRKNGTVALPIPSICDITNSSINSGNNLLAYSKRKGEETPSNHNQISNCINPVGTHFLSTFENSKEIQPSLNNRIISNVSNHVDSSQLSESQSSSSNPPSSSTIKSIISQQIQSKANGNSGTVYKPKFHKLATSSSNSPTTQQNQKVADIEVNASSNYKMSPFDTSALVITRNNFLSSTSQLASPMAQQRQVSFSSTLTNTRVSTPSTRPVISPQGKISGDRRFDRQSLDDRISKIIDENQSILATLPDYLTKRQRSHHNSGGSSGSNSYNSFSLSPRVSKSPLMSGGTTTELLDSSGSINSPFDLSLRKTSVDNLSPGASRPKTILVRSQSDLSESLVLRNLHLFSPAPSTSSMSGMEPRNLPTSEVLGANEPFVVPKKRRKLSPAAFCGGEVSELSSLQLSERTKTAGPNPSQDMDMTLRVSNCSGAKVTVRSNTSSSHNIDNSNSRKISIPSSSGGYVSVLGDGGHDRNNLKIIMGSEAAVLTNFSSMISPRMQFNEQQKRVWSNNEQGLDLKVGKPRGRPPKKHSTDNGSRKISDSVLNLTSPISLSISPRPERKSTSVLPSPTALDLKKPMISSISNIKEISTMSNIINMNSSLPSPNSQSKTTSLLSTAMPISTCDIVIKNEKNAGPDATAVIQSSAPNPKRPNFLALRPTNPSLKKKCFGSSLVLPSPDTPRGAKPYNQMYINGHAYTYLGFKVSTRSSYTCLFRPQPMFIPQETDPKLSMYSNWQPLPRDPNAPNRSISTNDSSVNNRKSSSASYVSATGKQCSTVTISASDKNEPIPSTYDSSQLTLTKGSPSGNSNSNEVVVMYTNSLPETDSISNDGLIVTSSFATTTTSSSTQSSLRISPSVSSMVQNSGTQVHQKLTPAEMKGDESSSSSVTSSISERSRKRHHHLNRNNGANARKYYDDPSKSRNESSSYAAAAALTLSQLRNAGNRQHAISSNSDFSCSADDESNGSTSRHDSLHRIHSAERNQKGSDTPMSLTLSQSHNSQTEANEFSSACASPSSRSEHAAKVRVIEGGFESNEDYTYIRGRGRGRYVCQACGIRCKKPSMLRKHLKTHTDLRPYTCTLCNFSFKTKGNLTKHQKSKSHHKKCHGLGIDPNSSRSLAMSGPTSGTDDDDSDDGDDDEEIDSNDDDDGGSSSAETENDSVEKEIAQSLLDLSRMTTFGTSLNNESKKPTLWRGRSISENQPLVLARSEQSLKVPPSKSSLDPILETPMDLSVKSTDGPSSFKILSTTKLEKTPNGVVRSMGVVGEAQRWEPEEELTNGCLNLTKVLNKNIVKHEISCDQSSNLEISSSETPASAPIDKPKTPPIVELKFEPANVENSVAVRALPQKMVATVRPYEFEITKKRRRLSKSCSDINSPACSTSNQSCTIQPKLREKPATTDKDTPATSSAPRAPKLHQPWLSPQGRQPVDDDEENDDTSSDKRDRAESFNSSTSASESILGIKDDLDNNNIEPSSSSPQDAQVIHSDDLPNSDLRKSPSKILAGLMSVKPRAEFRQPSGAQAIDEGKAECNVCGKIFARASQLTLHMNIHYLERPFRCDPCGVSFRTKGHLIKHRRSSSHDCKVYLTEAWGVANEENPRPFKCADCKIAFRIHGHLAKHLRSKMHIMRMECLGKLPFGIYFEMEKSGMNLNEIDTTDCDMSLVSLQTVAKKIYGDSWVERLTVVPEEAVQV